MYDLVYEQIVRTGVANHLDPESYYYINVKGKKLRAREESVDLQVKIEVTHPGYCLETKSEQIYVKKMMGLYQVENLSHKRNKSKRKK